MKMKISNKKYNFVIAISLCILLSSCSWIGDFAEPENDSYEAGKKALNEGKFELAKAKLREITPESPNQLQLESKIQRNNAMIKLYFLLLILIFINESAG